MSSPRLRKCSVAARGFWIDMLCLAAQHDPIGYLCVNGESLTTSDMARNAGISEAEAASLLAELIRNGVCSRDRTGRLYSRRMIRDAREAALARKNGAKGGNPSLSKQRPIPPPDNPPDKAWVYPRSQNPDTRAAAAACTPPPLPLDRACRAMGTSLDMLRRKPAWLLFGDFLADLCAQGCDAERDIWPTIERLSARGRLVPQSPAYFKTAILAARDLRLGLGAGGVPRTTVQASAREWAERLAVHEREGVWSSQWGPKPGAAGCLAPAAGRENRGT